MRARSKWSRSQWFLSFFALSFTVGFAVFTPNSLAFGSCIGDHPWSLSQRSGIVAALVAVAMVFTVRGPGRFPLLPVIVAGALVGGATALLTVFFFAVSNCGLD
jgi:hypothetical protein